MTWAQALDIAKFAREILLSTAVIVGGLWAIYRYRKLDRKEAQLELKRLESQIGLTSYLNISIATSVRQDGDKFDIIGDVRIHNPGTAGLSFNVSEIPPIRVARLELDDTGEYAVTLPARTLNFLATEALGSSQVESEGDASLKFVARVEGPALYLVEFWSRIGVDTQNVDFPSTSWMSSTIVEVSADAAACRTLTPPASAKPSA